MKLVVDLSVSMRNRGRQGERVKVRIGVALGYSRSLVWCRLALFLPYFYIIFIGIK